MRFKMFLLFFLFCVLFCACSDNNKNPTFPFERTISDVTIVKRCADGTFAVGANCYLLRWQHPIEKKDLESYYVWLDTTVVNDPTQKVSQAQMEQAIKSIPYSDKGDGDSLDLTNLISEYLERDSVHVAIWAKYSGSDQGVVHHLYAHFGDDVPPAIVYFRDSASANTIWIDWIRPVDQRDFYFPNIMDGPIAGYNVVIEAVNTTEDIRNTPVYVNNAEEPISSSDLRRFYAFDKDGRKVVLKGPLNNSDPKFLIFAIIDGKGFVSGDTQENNWRMAITGLRPEHSYNITMVAFDSSGNSSARESRRVKTTDAIPPLIANKLWFYEDSPGSGVVRLDSNRVLLFWPRSVDPCRQSDVSLITINSRLVISPGACYEEVEAYSIEQWSGNAWEPIPPRPSAIKTNLSRFRLENDEMIPDSDGEFVGDTLRWILPGETIALRMRAIDRSGHYSVAFNETINVSKGEFGGKECPPNYMPVAKNKESDDESVFCMEKLQYAEGNNFKRNVLFIEAKSICEALNGSVGFEGFTVSLCTEQEWDAACSSNGSTYGVIEEKDESGYFSPNEFLFRYCGVGTGDSLSANSVNKRNKICVSPDGIRDLPGQLQEWVIGNGEVPLLKGTSHVIFQGASRLELAQCKNKFTPTRKRPGYTTDSIFLYRSGSRIDTLLARDTLRKQLYDSISPNYFKDTLLLYSLKSKGGIPLGTDYVNQAEYRRRKGDEWLEELWQGLDYELKEERRVLFFGPDSTINASSFFLDSTVGFRCCANK
ncbi:MAG: hypothetical protein LBU89_01770 [Fibromonadaceae bacterium]|nr:hypothetical protein [Fibromonadaceae bacterium]